jgi:tRNA threonylcarbamoyl adenosine modification protein (Sua5/YciO/YrdC/YwlC family)
MAKRIVIHPKTPQPRLIEQAAGIIGAGGLAVYPTDSCYALGCDIANADGIARIRRIRRKDRREHLSLLCRDLSEIAVFAQVDNQAYRLLKKLLPGPYTLIFRATREVPKRLLGSRRKTIGIRMPSHPVAQALLARHGGPLISSTARLPDESMALNEPEDIVEHMDHLVDVIVDGGPCGLEPTSVVDLTGEVPQVLRAGAGDTGFFE